MNQDSIQKWIKITALGMLLGATAAIELFVPRFFSELYALIKTGHIQEVADYLASYEMFAALLSIYVNTLINILGFPPSIILSTANGIVFGIVGGTFVSWIAECFGTIIGFVLMKSLLRPTAIALVEKSKYIKKIDEKCGANGFKLVLFMRMIPYFPSVVITALAAVSSISLRNYVIATIIGKFPSTAIEVIVGHDLVNYHEHLLRLTIIGIALIVGYITVAWVMRRKK
ncbi:MAG: TVP38/TMEM64 family protein [Negativicutes bacterium]|jgi:uncharacterized membrane protein YdjX (TVP38/TMEM64 family)